MISSIVRKRSQRRVSDDLRRENILFLLLVLPNLALFAIFTYYPLFYNFRLSFARWDMLAPVKTWVGLNNYLELLQSNAFGRVLTNTAVFTLGSVGITCVLGLVIALLLNQPLRGRDAVRSIVFSPVMLSGAAIGIVWIFVLDPRFGVLAQVLGAVGLRSPNWLLDRSWAMTAIIIVYVWRNIGYAVVIYLAGLKAIPKELYEAAVVDGAGGLARLRYVTLPGLSPVTFFLLLTNVMASFQAFDVIRVMTNGGPVDATTTLIYYLYEEGFVGFNAGRAAVAAMVLFAAMFSFALVQMRFGERQVHYA